MILKALEPDLWQEECVPPGLRSDKPEPIARSELVLTIVEKVLFLQKVDIFNHTTTEELAYIGSIATEEQVPRGTVIFRQDEPADAMYVIVQGQVRLHKDEQEILIAAEKEAFGTWALFDTEPRLMTATAIEDVHLLRIEQEDFYDLLADHIEITQSIFKALVQRIKRLIGSQTEAK